MTGHISRDMMMSDSEKSKHEYEERRDADSDRNRVGGKYPERTGYTDQAEGDRKTVEDDLKRRDAQDRREA